MRNALLPSLIALTALSLAACGGRDVRSFDEVERDFENPTGTVDAEAAPTVFSKAFEVGDADASVAMASAFDSTGTLGSTLVAETQELAWNHEALGEDGCNVDLNFNGQGEIRTLEVVCTDNPDVDGRFSMEFEYEGDVVHAMWMDFDMWCGTDGCVDGSMGMQFGESGDAMSGLTTKILYTASLDLHQDGAVAHVEWGLRMTYTDTSATVEWLVYGEHAGETRSWVLSASADEMGGTLEVRGANGRFSCTYSAAGESGQCTGPEGNSFSWSA